MKFGQIHVFESPHGRSEQSSIREQIDLMVHAETCGFDSVWVAEHHFSDYGICATPALALAAVAARTRRIRLGSAVTVLPLNHPVRVAEDYAFLDQLSGGRIDLGIGRGYQPAEFEGYGADAEHSRELFAESLDVLRKAWTQERVDYRGRHVSVEGASVRPRPLQHPHPPLWMACLSRQSFEACGRQGLHLLCAPVFGFDLEAGAAHVGDYRAALRAAGHDTASHEVGALTITYVAESRERAEEEFRDAVLWYYRTLAERIPGGDGGRPAAGYETYAEARRFLQTVDWDTVMAHGAVVCGSPDDVAERIDRVAKTCGITTYLAWTRIGGLAADRVRRSMELMGERVIPQLR